MAAIDSLLICACPEMPCVCAMSGNVKVPSPPPLASTTRPVVVRSVPRPPSRSVRRAVSISSSSSIEPAGPSTQVFRVRTKTPVDAAQERVLKPDTGKGRARDNDASHDEQPASDGRPADGHSLATPGVNPSKSLRDRRYQNDDKEISFIGTLREHATLEVKQSLIFGVTFANSVVNGITFFNCVLINVTFTDCELEGVDFTNVHMENVNFIGSNMEDVLWRNMSRPDQTFGRVSHGSRYTGNAMPEAVADIKYLEKKLESVAKPVVEEPPAGVTQEEVDEALARELHEELNGEQPDAQWGQSSDSWENVAIRNGREGGVLSSIPIGDPRLSEADERWMKFET